MTYSIIARDPETQEMGIACQSQAFAVGSSVPWGEPGYGVIATQSIAEPAYGELGLDLLRGGLTAEEALTSLRSIDPHVERRQLAMLDSHGHIAAYTGDACVAEAGHLVGDDCCALANMAASPSVWEAMVEAFQESDGSLAGRLVTALEAAEGAGGDLRGRRSAAVLVVQSSRTGRPWEDRLADLRVDDHADPVGQLRRLVEASERYHRVVRVFEQAIDGDPEGAAAQVGEDDLASAEPDLVMWQSTVLAMAGRKGQAVSGFERLATEAPQFLETARRMAATDLADPTPVLDIIEAVEGAQGQAASP